MKTLIRRTTVEEFIETPAAPETAGLKTEDGAVHGAELEGTEADTDEAAPRCVPAGKKTGR